MARAEPAFTRLDVEERRRLLLELGRSLFTRRPYDELSMAAIAREAGISKALLYHYFPSKQAFFVATLQDAARELAARVRPDADLPPRAQLDAALGEWLRWVEANRETYGRVLLASASVPEVRQLIQVIRSGTADLIIERLGAGPAPALRVAVTGWLWMMDGVCLEWVSTSGIDRARVHRLVAGALPGVLRAAGHPEIAARIS